MTIEEKIKEMLFERGMFEDQCSQVVARMKADPANEAMSGRWQDKPEDYPPMIMSLMWFSACNEAVKFIDETCPKAWFREIFFVEGK
jgi:hypothetical protein